jgi:uncharacterized protein YceK
MRRLAVLLMASLLLAACGSSTSPSAATSSAPADSAGAGIVGPVILDADHTSASVAVGRMVVFNVDNPESWAISADPQGIVKVQQGANDGSAIFNPGAEALAPGTATVTLSNPSGDTLVFTITVE